MIPTQALTIQRHPIVNPDSIIPDSKVHGAHMGPIWGRQVPGGPHVGPMNFAICDGIDIWVCFQKYAEPKCIGKTSTEISTLRCCPYVYFNNVVISVGLS